MLRKEERESYAGKDKQQNQKCQNTMPVMVYHSTVFTRAVDTLPVNNACALHFQQSIQIFNCQGRQKEPSNLQDIEDSFTEKLLSL
ncbi:unnamed protein product [Ixodes persulcatus]